MTHPDEGTIHAWLDDALDAEEALAIEQHVATCEAGAALVAEARGFIAASSRILSALDDVPSGVLPEKHVEDVHSLDAARARRTSRWWMRPQVAAAALVFVAAGSWFLATSGSGNKMQVQDLATEIDRTARARGGPFDSSAPVQLLGERKQPTMSAPITAPAAAAPPAVASNAPARADAEVSSLAPDRRSAKVAERPEAASVTQNAAVGTAIGATAGAGSAASSVADAAAPPPPVARQKAADQGVAAQRVAAAPPPIATRADTVGNMVATGNRMALAAAPVSSANARALAGCYRISTAKDGAVPDSLALPLQLELTADRDARSAAFPYIALRLPARDSTHVLRWTPFSATQLRVLVQAGSEFRSYVVELNTDGQRNISGARRENCQR